MRAATQEGGPSLGKFQTIEFVGKDRVHAKHKALDYWCRHRTDHRMSLEAFFQRCRLSPDQRRIVFLAAPLDGAAPRG